MTDTDAPYIAVSLPFAANAQDIYHAFTLPEWLTQFWLKSAEGPLELGKSIRWDFLVPGASEQTTATQLQPGERVAFAWSDGVHADIAITPGQGDCVVRVVITGIDPTDVAAAVNAAEGFSLVLADLKLLLETGRSPGLVAAKASLIARPAAAQ